MDLQQKYLNWHHEAAGQDTLRTFAFFSANLRQLLPKLPWKEHLDRFKQLLNNQARATDEKCNLNWLANRTLLRTFLDQLTQPGIIAAFHTGPYRLPSMWLMKQRIPFTLVVSSDVMESQGEANRRLHEKIIGRHDPALFDMLTAEDHMVLRKMMRALQQGRYIFLYIDGNVGSGNRAGKGLLTIDFLAARLSVRTGCGSLSFLSKVPIYPVLPYFDGSFEPKLNTLPLIKPTVTMERDAYVSTAMKTLYSSLEKLLHKYPMQWEGWLYIQHDLPGQPLENASFLQHYMPFALDEHYFLLHKESYFIYPIPKQLYDKIWNKFLAKRLFSLY